MTTPTGYEYVRPKDDSWKIVRWVRTALTLLVIPVAMSAFKDEYGEVPLLSGIDVAIHEFGHNLFMPFGWMPFGEVGVVMGGSLTQIAFPSLFVGYFLFSKKNRDIHAATICLFWVAINVLSVAIYAGDARAGVLQLINGATGQDEDSGHDFQYLFRRWGVMSKDTLYSGRMRAIAGLLVFISVAGGLLSIWLAKAPKDAATE